MQTLLNLNAHVKFVEFVLHNFDNAPADKTLGELRSDFEKRFNTIHPLLNQFFGIYRLIPLIQIKEEYKRQKKELYGDIEKVKIIRDAIAHSNFYMDENGYTFKNNKDEVKFSFLEFNSFIHRIENDFYETVTTARKNEEE